MNFPQKYPIARDTDRTVLTMSTFQWDEDILFVAVYSS